MEKILKNRLSQLGRFEPRRTALLGIHWQNDLVRPEGAFGPIFANRVKELALVERMVKVYDAARRCGTKVVHANVAFYPGHPEVVPNNALFRTGIANNAFVRGTRGAAVVDELLPQPGDFVVEHSRISAFYGNDLQILLKSIDCKAVFVTGVATNVAVDHTVRDAVQFGYDTILLEDCCCSSDQAFHDAALLTLRALASHVLVGEEFIALCESHAAA